jgi:DNA-binding transcriptional regulator YhcF (GntR family)
MIVFTEKKLDEVPHQIAKLALKASLDTSLTQAAIHIFGYFCLNATATGYIIASTNPQDVADAVGINRATVFRAYAILEKAKYITWVRANGFEKAQGITGRIQIRTFHSFR